MDKHEQHHDTNEPARSTQAGRMLTANRVLVTYIARQPIPCAQCGYTIAIGERFTRPWQHATRTRAATCRRCLAIIELDDALAAARDRARSSRGVAPTDVALSDAQWAAIRPHVPATVIKPDALTDRAVFAAVLYRLGNRCTWAELPERYGRWQACRWRSQEWIMLGALPAMLDAFLGTLNDHERRIWAPLLKREEEPTPR